MLLLGWRSSYEEARSPAVEELGTELKELGRVSDMLDAGSLATGDFIFSVGDLDAELVQHGLGSSGGHLCASSHP